MALTINGVQVRVKESQLPTTTYVRPTVTTFTDYEYRLTKFYDIGKLGVDDPDPATTFGALITALQAAVNTDITNDFDVTNTVEAYIDLNDVGFNIDFDNAPYTDATASYRCNVTAYIKTS